jgi:membrane-bound lytic murein transglycosylase B
MRFINFEISNLKLIALTAGTGFLLPVFFVFAFTQQTSLNLADVCESDANLEAECGSVSKADCKKILEDCQNYFEEKKAQVEKEVTQTAQQKKSLKTQVSGLDQKIKDLSYQINQSNLTIKDLNFQIEDTRGSIDKTSLDIDEEKKKIALVLQAAYEEDEKSAVEIILANDTISDFYDNLVYLENLSSKNEDLLKSIQDMKNYLEGQKSTLENETEDMKNTVAVRELQKQESAVTKKDKEYYLTLTEAQYNQKVKEQQDLTKKVAELKSRIFDLAGVSNVSTFGEAYQLAKNVATLTGIRPAIVLAILTQESNIGKNVGQCYLKNDNTGSGVLISTGASVAKVMSPTRDVPPFKKITAAVDRDPYATRVSCPMSFGWGGATGPAQFIPSTWMSYKSRIEAMTGNPADPWDISDAFLATALYLSDYGAKSKTRDGEWRAAMIYFSGSTNVKYRFYGDSALKIADGYADDIAAIEALNQ